MSPGHKCVNSLLFCACCLYSDNLCVPWFVFITECEFDIRDMERTPSVSYWHVSGVLTHRLLKWCPNLIHQHSWKCVSRCATGISKSSQITNPQSFSETKNEKKHKLHSLTIKTPTGNSLWLILTVSQFL